RSHGPPRDRQRCYRSRLQAPAPGRRPARPPGRAPSFRQDRPKPRRLLYGLRAASRPDRIRPRCRTQEALRLPSLLAAPLVRFPAAPLARFLALPLARFPAPAVAQSRAQALASAPAQDLG